LCPRETTEGELIFMGPPGSGKGTQARLLTDEHGWVHLSTGDLFRDHLRRGTALGTLAEAHMSKGRYVPDEVTVGMVRERVAGIPRATRIVFDGFPRTLPQASALDELLRERGRAVGRAVLIEVPRAALIERLSARATGRSDDSPEVIAKRLDVYEEQTRPVIERYERAGALVRVDGVGKIDEVRARIALAIAA
jgi:adenylate kinase